jgi:hypothetical protein
VHAIVRESCLAVVVSLTFIRICHVVILQDGTSRIGTTSVPGQPKLDSMTWLGRAGFLNCAAEQKLAGAAAGLIPGLHAPHVKHAAALLNTTLN